MKFIKILTCTCSRIEIGNTFSLILYFGIIFFRLIPHPPNMTPVIAFIIFLSLERYAILTVFLNFMISDEILGLISHSPLFGMWSFYTYSGIILIIFVSKSLRNTSLLFGLSATLFYWFWTNLGVWISSGLYPLNIRGLWICYEAAIPFLANNFIGTVMGFIFVLLYKINLHLKPANC